MTKGKLFDPDSVFVIAEIGINHNGSVETAHRLIDVALEAGVDAVKFQKKTPELSLPQPLWYNRRPTPWGTMNYIDYRRKMEFNDEQYCDIADYCGANDIIWFASPWDLPSVEFLKGFGLPLVKVASACITDMALLEAIIDLKTPVLISTGMSTEEQILQAVWKLIDEVPELGIMACTSTYPCPVEDLNLSRIGTLEYMFPWATIGYSGHEAGLWTTLMAVSMGARIVERHITLDRAMVGSDQAASIEPQGLKLLVREIRNFEKAKGDGVLGLRKGEDEQINRLRKVK